MLTRLKATNAHVHSANAASILRLHTYPTPTTAASCAAAPAARSSGGVNTAVALGCWGEEAEAEEARWVGRNAGDRLCR